MGRTINTGHLQIDIEDITVDDMPNDALKEIFDLCGKEVAISLMEHQNGVFIFMPARPFMKLEKRIMISEFDGSPTSIRNIARKYCISEAIVRDELKKAKLQIIK